MSKVHPSKLSLSGFSTVDRDLHNDLAICLFNLVAHPAASPPSARTLDRDWIVMPFWRLVAGNCVLGGNGTSILCGVLVNAANQPDLI